jgi:hypothetical protein
MANVRLTPAAMLELATEFLVDREKGIWIRKKNLNSNEYVIQNELDEYFTSNRIWEHKTGSSVEFNKKTRMSLAHAFELAASLDEICNDEAQ